MSRVITVLGLVVLFLGATSTFAQNATINVSGTVTDAATGRPIEKEYEIVFIAHKSGKRISTKIDKRGTYLQPLTSGDSYTVILSSYFILRKTDTIVIEPTNKFHTETHNYKVHQISQGDELARLCAFEPGQSTLAVNSRNQLNALLETFKENVELQIVVMLNQEQNPPLPPPPAKTVKSSKKHAKGAKNAAPEVQPETQAQQFLEVDPHLYDTRIEELKRFFSAAKNSEIRLRIEQGPNLLAAPGQQNLVVKIGEVKSILDD